MRPVLILLALVAGAVAVRLWLPDAAFSPRAAVAWLRDLGPWAGVVFVAAYLVLTTFAVPALAFHITAGVVFGMPWGFVWALIGAQLSSNVQFLIGTQLGADRVSAWLKSKGLGHHFEKDTLLELFLLRLVPTPFVATNAGCGASGMKWRRFALGSGLGLVPNTFVHTLFAASLYEGVEGAKLKALGWAAAAGAGLVLIAWLGRRARNRRPSPS